MESSEKHPDYITVYKSIGGWKAIHLTWESGSPDWGGYYEPFSTGMGAYMTEEEAVEEAKEWASDSGLEFCLRGTQPSVSR